ncbi:type IV pilin protein [Pseudothauera nasutitermitis]
MMQTRSHGAQRPPGQRGFSLIELMIVVVIVGVLASIVYPSYQEHVRKTRRADAQAALMELTQFMERRYTTNGRYGAAGCAGVALPFTRSPKDGGTVFYNIGIVCNADTFTLTAVPTGPMANDACGNLAMTHTGARGRSGGAPMELCWRR